MSMLIVIKIMFLSILLSLNQLKISVDGLPAKKLVGTGIAVGIGYLIKEINRFHHNNHHF